jgi:hypothetical protein
MPVRLIERFANLKRDAPHLIEGERTTHQTFAQGFALDIFHNEVGQTLLRADIVQRTDVGVIERGYRVGLALETLKQLPRGPGYCERGL